MFAREALANALTLTLLLAASAGCRGTDEVEPVVLLNQPPPGVEAAGTDAQAERDLMALAAERLPLVEPPGTRFFSPEDAPEAPTLEVSDLAGNEIDLKPGTRGYAMPGNVTLVVFWSLDLPQGKAAAAHVRDLARDFARWRVRPFYVVERTLTANEAEPYARKYGMEGPLYYDDLSALGRMSRRADAEVTRAVPSIFIIDARQRLRFHRPGFQHVGTAVLTDSGRLRPLPLQESAPAGGAVRDYLIEILSQR